MSYYVFWRHHKHHKSNFLKWHTRRLENFGRMDKHETRGSLGESKWELTYLLTPWNTVLLEKLTGSQLVKKRPTFYGTRRSITAFTNVRHLPLSWARSIQSIPPSRFLIIHLNIILSSVPGFSKWSLPSGFLTKNYSSVYLNLFRIEG